MFAPTFDGDGFAIDVFMMPGQITLTLIDVFGVDLFSVQYVTVGKRALA